jgi:MFS family permease
LWLIFANELWMLYLFAVVYGLGYGGFAAVCSPLVADFFGLKALGAIFGLANMASSIGGALGPLTAGRIFDISGSYHWAFILCAALAIAALIMSTSLKAARTE